MDDSIICQNGQSEGRFPGRLGKNIDEQKEGQKIVGDENKQDNALKESPVLFSRSIRREVICDTLI
jgi:hypothetical protein